MTIQWLGHSCFKLSTKTGNNEVIVVTDPYSNDIGFRFPKTSADIVTISHDHFDHNNYQEIKGNLEEAPFIIKEAGEYETKGVFVQSIETFHDDKSGVERGKNLAFLIHIEDATVLHLGDLGHELSNEQVEAIGDVDILLIPVGGKYTINAKIAVDVVKAIEPRIVIPMHYKIPGLKVEIESADAFLKNFGSKVETMKKLKVAKKDLMAEETKVVVLEKE
ncbi:MAG: MBL fold metallo-hydrolase [Candidatus Falkowbacteria bacterium]